MIAVISHDAGGAEILSSYVRRNGLSGLFALEGPARGVFARKLGRLDPISVEEAIGSASWVLCGTSWQSDLEWRAIRLARQIQKRTVTFLDHWVNYRERFERDGQEHLPDEIWVGDEPATKIARRLFPDVPVSHVPNPYFDDVEGELRAAAARLGTRAAGEPLRILYVSEPIAEHAQLRYGSERHWGYTEFDALHYFLSNVAALGLGHARIVLRPHPAEAADKYSGILDAQASRVVLGGSTSLVDDIVASDVVVGCNSMAMVVGLLARKRVVSCVPPGGAPCLLPQTEIESMRDLVGGGFGGGHP